ncbi:37S ribosomal protein rsm25 [Pseudomassariella vexata]|uniref:37S ribosomal protein S25, mitochondrial n=1 Tax=Pseudomassariella vexata TaxID=1141098 RepID=A0A1Y2DCI0_9PEZI|nr:37S ribosomal protein rsm25 [Pseudomassariella vexata]ORY56907.1 37S ribosomal protein rsm25 [Pseudomassariella vexata]
MVRKPHLRQVRPARVYQTVTKLMDHRVMPKLRVQQPVWYKVVESIPPSEMITRPLPPQHIIPKGKERKPSRLYQPQQLTYPEDKLRRRFYRDHPWELARPRMIVEMDGKDSQRCDWSKGLRQPGMQLSGESVVQRQLWLLENVPGIGTNQAYDQVRREFYALRQEEEIERRVAREEARMVGSYFGQTFIQVGMLLEDQQYEKWKKWAEAQTALIKAEQSEAYASFSNEDPDNLDVEALDEVMAQTQTAST